MLPVYRLCVELTGLGEVFKCRFVILLDRPGQRQQRGVTAMALQQCHPDGDRQVGLLQDIGERLRQKPVEKRKQAGKEKFVLFAGGQAAVLPESLKQTAA